MSILFFQEGTAPLGCMANPMHERLASRETKLEYPEDLDVETPTETGAGRCGEAERVAMAEGADGAEEETFQLASNKQLSDLLRELCELRERGSFCDVVVEVQSCRYLAHKAVLSSTCRYFRSLFLSAPCSSMGPFVVDFLSIRTFELIVDFIYKGHIRASRDEMRGLYCAALDLGLECLEEACRPFKSETDDWGDGSPSGESDEGSDVRMSVVEMQRAEETQEAPTAAVDLSGRQACATVTATATIKHRMWNRELQVAACRSVPRDLGGDAADASTPLLLDVKEEPFSASENGDDDCNGDYNGASAETPPPGGDSAAPPAGNGTAPPYAILGGSGAGFGEELQCQACGEFVGENDTSLREHARAVHLDRATLSCRVCGKKFSLLSNAMQHVVVHTGIAVLQCHDCRRQFVSETRLNLHREHHCKKLKQLLARGGGRGRGHARPREVGVGRRRGGGGGGRGGGVPHLRHIGAQDNGGAAGARAAARGHGVAGVRRVRPAVHLPQQPHQTRAAARGCLPLHVRRVREEVPRALSPA
ncbi:uncharacterized protein LOC144730664 isoform X2 [Lampetra planeri]